MKRRVLLTIALLACSPALAHAQWGTVTGRIVWDDPKIPARQNLGPIIQKNLDKNFCLSAGPVLREDWVIDPKTKGIQWTFVWLTDGDPKLKKKLAIHPDLMKPDKERVEIDQPVCMFVPHALALREGQTLVCKNTAKVAHNFNHRSLDGMLGANPLIQPGNDFVLGPKQGLTADRQLLFVDCGIHPWMKAYVRIFDHPYFAVTGPDGAFAIKDAPVGKLNLIVWHGTGGWRGGALGRTGKVIEIKKGVTDLGDLPFPPP